MPPGGFSGHRPRRVVSDGWYLMVMVTDSHLSSPYTAEHFMTLNLSGGEEPYRLHHGWARNLAGEGTYNPLSTRTRTARRLRGSRLLHELGGRPVRHYPRPGRNPRMTSSPRSSAEPRGGGIHRRVERHRRPRRQESAPIREQIISFFYTTAISQSDKGGRRSARC